MVEFVKRHFFYIRLFLSLLILAYLLTFIEIDRVRLLFQKLRLEYIWQPFFLLLLTHLSTGMRWSYLLHQFKIRQSIMDSWRYYLIGGYYSTVLPGVIGGDVVRLGLSINAHSQSKAIITTSILFERVCGIMVILIMASVAALSVPMLMAGERPLLNLIVSISIGAFALFILFFLILKSSPDAWFKNSHSHNKWKAQAISLLSHLRSLSLGALTFFLILSILAHLFDITGSYYLSRALLIDQPFTVFLLIMPLVYILTILPVSIGGIGIREGVLTFFLVKMGVLASDAVMLALMIYLNRVIVGLIGGMLQFINKKNMIMDKP